MEDNIKDKCHTVFYMASEIWQIQISNPESVNRAHSSNKVSRLQK